MVITLITSGLGNQMFQYAAGRALAARLNTSLKLDISYYQNNPHTRRYYDLGRFCLEGTIAKPWEVTLLQRLSRPRVARLTRPLRALGLPLESTVLLDPVKGYQPECESVKGHAYLSGMWQSEKYFAAQADVIRRDFAFRHEPDAANREAIEKIHATEAVALHVRRGDKVHIPEVGACDLSYYDKAIAIVMERVPNPHFFIFSDDAAWTKEHVTTPAPATYITHNTGRQDAEDLRLMSHCKHFVIANSTFSWWGAWLGTNPSKLVISPSSYFADPNISMLDRIPDGWVQL